VRARVTPFTAGRTRARPLRRGAILRRETAVELAAGVPVRAQHHRNKPASSVLTRSASRAPQWARVHAALLLGRRAERSRGSRHVSLVGTNPISADAGLPCERANFDHGLQFPLHQSVASSSVGPHPAGLGSASRPNASMGKSAAPEVELRRLAWSLPA
jgi:hypothetical protein